MTNNTNSSAIATFKAKVLASAAETKAAWERGENKFINRHADLMMVDVYVRFYGANEQELKNFIEEAYKI